MQRNVQYDEFQRSTICRAVVSTGSPWQAPAQPIPPRPVSRAQPQPRQHGAARGNVSKPQLCAGVELLLHRQLKGLARSTGPDCVGARHLLEDVHVSPRPVEVVPVQPDLAGVKARLLREVLERRKLIRNDRRPLPVVAHPPYLLNTYPYLLNRCPFLLNTYPYLLNTHPHLNQIYVSWLATTADLSLLSCKGERLWLRRFAVPLEVLVREAAHSRVERAVH